MKITDEIIEIIKGLSLKERINILNYVHALVHDSGSKNYFLKKSAMEEIKRGIKGNL